MVIGDFIVDYVNMLNDDTVFVVLADFKTLKIVDSQLFTCDK